MIDATQRMRKPANACGEGKGRTNGDCKVVAVERHGQKIATKNMSRLWGRRLPEAPSHYHGMEMNNSVFYKAMNAES